jgi:hypothetical protein
MDNGLADGDNVPLPNGASDASAWTYHTRVRYGVRDDLTLFIDLPAVEKRVHTPNGVVSNSGLGDLTFLGKYKYAENKSKTHRRAFAAFYKARNGEYRNLPGLLATGSGQDNVGLIHLWEWGRGDTTWYANMGYVWTDERSDTNVDPGDLMVFNAAAEHKLGHESPWNFVWEINGRYQGSSEIAGRDAPNTGATIISLTAGLQYTKKKPGGPIVTLEAGVQLPVVTEGDLPALPDHTVYVGGYVIF